MAALFISDLHLDASRPAATTAFVNFLEQDATDASALYILGDLFEAWFSDDDPNPHYQLVKAGLAKLTDSGTPCYIMHGNRDFMLGQKFCFETGCRLLHDPTLIYVGSESVLISHGDFLCTDDLSYQRFRRIVRSAWFRSLFGLLPFSLKQRLAAKARSKSNDQMDFKPPEILDVNQQTVATTLEKYNVDTLLHGHTHRPAIHNFESAGQTMRRIVLGDWYECGSVLRWDENGPELVALEFAASS